MDETPRTVASVSVEIDRHTLRFARQERGLTQAELGRLCNISVSFVSHLEGGRRTHVSAPVYAALCKVLKTGQSLRSTSQTSLSAA